MRRFILAVALLLASAPVAGATEITPNSKPEMRPIEVAAPVIRQDIQVVPTRVEERKPETRATQMRMGGTTTAILLVLAAVGLIVLVSAL